MNPPLWFDNLAALCTQVALLAIVGAMLPRIFRLRAPNVAVLYWQSLLMVCLVLPIVQPWQRLMIPLPTSFGTVDFTTGPAVADPSHSPFPIFQVIAAALVCGVVIRLLWIGLGLRRLRQYQRRARLLWPIPICLKELRSVARVDPRLLISEEIEGPATCGIVDPAVLFPARFVTMDTGCQRAIACHEFIHVRRRDWLFNLAEELILAVFWFHPAMWWVIRQIRLTREQTVDQEVVRFTEARRPYIQALLELATGGAARPPVPAPLFLKESQLTQRVALILKEADMSKSRLFLSLAVIFAFLLATTVVAARAFPLKARAIESAPIGSQQEKTATTSSADDKTATTEPQAKAVTSEDGSSDLKPIRKVPPEYPPLAKMAHIQGIVTLDVTVEKNGEVSNVEAVSGHPLLVQAATEAVRQWRFEPQASAPLVTTVKVNFTLSKDSSDEEKFAEAKIMLDQRQAEELARVIPDQQAALAKSAHIQGTVTLDVTMEKNGEISTMRVLGGDERLAKALVEQTLRKAQQDSLATDLSERKMLLDELQRSQQGNQVEVSEKALAVARAQRAQADAQIAKLERAISEAKNGSNSESELKPVKTVAPEYPAQAKRDHVEGMVVVNVTVEQDGTVSSVEVVSGPAALTKAAVEAVKQWRFSEPRFAPVKTTVTLNFALDQGKN